MRHLQDITMALKLSNGNVTLPLEMEVEEDVPAELEHFVRLVMLGEDQAAIDYYERVLKPHVHAFPVFAEYADLLVCMDDGRRIQLLLSNLSTDTYSESEKELVQLLSTLVPLLISGSTNSILELEQDSDEGYAGDSAPEPVLEAQATAVAAINNATNLQAFIETGCVVNEKTTAVEIRLFQVACRLRHHMGTPQIHLDSFYSSLLNQQHFWEASKVFILYLKHDVMTHVSFQLRTSRATDTEMANLSQLAVSIAYLDHLSIARSFDASQDLHAATHALSVFFDEQVALARLILKTSFTRQEGGRIQQWTIRTLNFYDTLAAWRVESSVDPPKTLLDCVARLVTVARDPNGQLRLTLNDLSTRVQQEEPIRRSLEAAIHILETDAKEVNTFRDASFSYQALPFRQASTNKASLLARSDITRRSTRSGRQDKDVIGSGRSPADSAYWSASRGSQQTSSYASNFLRSFAISGETAEHAVEVDSEGQTIGGEFVIGKQIGYGGFSVIKEAFTGYPQRKVAVKIVRRTVMGLSEAANEEAQGALEHEIDIWRLLHHRHIMPLEAIYGLQEATFCFMSFNAGGTLFDLVRANRGTLSQLVVTGYTYQIALGLDYLHTEALIVHRDLKLENCLLEQNPDKPDDIGLVRLCDFGMAECIPQTLDQDSASTVPTRTDTQLPTDRDAPARPSPRFLVGGSHEYLAPEVLTLISQQNSTPEQALSDDETSLTLSPAIDMWALGVCAFTLAVGKRPFQDVFQPRVVQKILAGDWDVDSLANKADGAAVECVKGCLSMDVGKRWVTKEVLTCEWLQDVESWMI